MKFKKALVTGGAGFIGSHIAKQLIEEGVETIIIDDLSTGKRSNIPNKAHFIQGDILNFNILSKACNGVDIIFHNAAKVSIRNSLNNFVEDAQTNILGTVNAIKAIINHRVKKLIFASSMAVYGNADKLPIPETHKLNPTSPYGIGKLSSEKYCLLMSKEFGFQTIVLRYFNTYGTPQSLSPYVGVLTIFINQALADRPLTIYGDGKQIRDFVSVNDIARANILAMISPVNGEIINIGSGQGQSVIEITKMLKNHFSQKVKISYLPTLPGEPKDSIADITKAQKLLRYKPQVQLEDVIGDIIKWNKSHLQISHSLLK